MVKIKTQPDHDSSVHVFWLERPDGGYDKVIVSVDQSSMPGVSALRVTAPGGEEVVFFAGEQVPEEFRAFRDEPEYATYPTIQVFLQPALDELRENPDVVIKDGVVRFNPLVASTGMVSEATGREIPEARRQLAAQRNPNPPRYPLSSAEPAVRIDGR